MRKYAHQEVRNRMLYVVKAFFGYFGVEATFLDLFDSGDFQSSVGGAA
jgi:hypothetical protein